MNKRGFHLFFLLLVTKVRKIDDKLPIIVISGGSRYVDSSFLSTAIALGANVSLEKPFKEEELLILINSLT